MNISNFVNSIMKYVSNNPTVVLEILFSGAGVAAFSAIMSMALKKKRKKKESIDIEKNQNYQISGNSNVAGNNNTVDNRIINFYNSNQVEKEKEEKSWFSLRFTKLIELLNESRVAFEKEFTVEFVSSLIGLENVSELKQYIKSNVEPDDQFKEKFVEVFGVNKDWMVYNRGEFPFASNIQDRWKNPMDILRYSDLRNIEKFIIVIGTVEGKRYACIIRKQGDYCYEVYPEYFVLYSDTGGTGKDNLVEFYRFLRESKKRNILSDLAYIATEEQMDELIKGIIAPKKVQKFELAQNFIENFLSIDSDSIKKNSNYWDDEFVKIQYIIADNIEKQDRINKEFDDYLIDKNVGNFDQIDKAENDIDDFEFSTPFFQYRFAKAFPGVRGKAEFTNSSDCIDRLGILLKTPLTSKKLNNPIWWFRGSRNFHISRFERLSIDTFLMNFDRIKVKKIIAYESAEYYKEFVYVETYPEEPTGIYEINRQYIDEYKRRNGFFCEEYAEWNDKLVSRGEYDDDAAVIDGKVVDLGQKAKLRIRYLTPYNFIICAQFNPINSIKYDSYMQQLLDGILEKRNSVDDIIEFVNK
ncbi:MAG: hypothetical protein ACI4FV_04325, partial [Lachnospiraceae bacterium]